MNFLTYSEIWDCLMDCANFDEDVALDAFYPEFYEAIQPHTAPFREAADIVHRSGGSIAERSIALFNHPMWGASVNVAGSTTFDYRRFFRAVFPHLQDLS